MRSGSTSGTSPRTYGPCLPCRLECSPRRDGSPMRWPGRAATALGRGRAELLSGVRPHHLGESASCPGPGWAARLTSARAGRVPGRLLGAAEAGARTGSVIEVLVLQALTHQARGETTTAVRSARACASVGRRAGLRPSLRRRGCADESPAARCAATASRRPLRASTALPRCTTGGDTARRATGCSTRGATQRARARCAAATGIGPQRTRHRP